MHFLHLQADDNQKGGCSEMDVMLERHRHLQGVTAVSADMLLEVAPHFFQKSR